MVRRGPLLVGGNSPTQVGIAPHQQGQREPGASLQDLGADCDGNVCVFMMQAEEGDEAIYQVP